MRRAYDTRPPRVDVAVGGVCQHAQDGMSRAAWTIKRTAPCPTGSRRRFVRPDLGRSNLCSTLQEEQSHQPNGQSKTFWLCRAVPFSLLTTGGVSCFFSSEARIIAIGFFVLVLISVMMVLLPGVWSRKPARRQAVRLLIRELRAPEPRAVGKLAPRTSKRRKPAPPPSSSQAQHPRERAPGPGWGSHREAAPEGRPRRGGRELDNNRARKTARTAARELAE
jgi:hypothetical protein